MTNHDNIKPEPIDPNYVSALEKHFSRIADKITLLWGTEEFPTFLSGLMLDNRGDRTGFPLAVIEEMMFLNEIHDARLDNRTVVTKDGSRIS